MKYVFEAQITGTCTIVLKANSKEEAIKMYEDGQCGEFQEHSEEWEYGTYPGRGAIYFMEEEEE